MSEPAARFQAAPWHMGLLYKASGTWRCLGRAKESRGVFAYSGAVLDNGRDPKDDEQNSSPRTPCEGVEFDRLFGMFFSRLFDSILIQQNCG